MVGPKSGFFTGTAAKAPKQRKKRAGGMSQAAARRILEQLEKSDRREAERKAKLATEIERIRARNERAGGPYFAAQEPRTGSARKR